MVLMDKFDSLSEENRIKDILYILENRYYSLAITLTSGDVLLGDPSFGFKMQYLHYSENYRNRDDYDSLKRFEKPISNRIVLLFPDGQGMVYGHAYSVVIPVASIARIQGIEPLININQEEMSFDHPGGSLALRNLPNPLSLSIKTRNLEIINRLGLKWCSYVEQALSEEAISGKNIIFSQEQIIYSDWNYWKNVNGGIRNIGGSFLGVGLSVGITRSNHDLASIKLHEDSACRGIIREAQENQTTKFEGDDAQVYDFILSGEASHKSMPLFIKEKCTIIPKEIIHRIDSELTVYGELYQIPIYMNGKKYESYLLARVIGYIPCKCDIS
jgi:hypothetical protein